MSDVGGSHVRAAAGVVVGGAGVGRGVGGSVVGRGGGAAAAVAAAPQRRRRHGRQRVAGLAGAAAAAAAAVTVARPSTLHRAVCLVLIAALCSTLLIATTASADDGGGWRYGRATFYGSMGGGSIDTGSCMYGGLPNGAVSTGTDIVAISDTADDYGGSCGRCYEVQCNPTSFRDGYGNHIDRTSPCFNGSKSVIVTVTDTCPCYYPANEYSNRRWCCGDMYHMDLSSQAFSQLADLGWGVIGTRFRVVGCPGGFKPSPRAATSDFPAGTKK
ncbi:hypothetical protein HXX76_014555 [Chlamydomonas incerta]|uniref:Expansin-like EG45 domain-containing protein n=1 Tax=Chlamydomonas incerta TaxID=51695 RepID=A0A835VT34_CHLIN|nr:hypothetical protein HXX76_014555 [Chlamydomonas incerta]|eukprot:KAG2424346.1 hypothetical protein HXX76_014555 [Chlamydomonas incerta]